MEYIFNRIEYSVPNMKYSNKVFKKELSGNAIRSTEGIIYLKHTQRSPWKSFLTDNSNTNN